MNAKTLSQCGLVLFILLSLVDLGLTCLLIRSSGGQIGEADPIAKVWLLRWGWQGLVIFKLGRAAVVATVILLINRQRPIVGVLVVAFACLVVGAVSYYSYNLLNAAAQQKEKRLPQQIDR